MTNLYDGQITDLLANGLRHNPEVIALSYAIQMEKQRIMDYAATTRTMAVIDELPEAILDVLAVELRSPYYRQDMTIEEKVDVIKGCTFAWFSKAGTSAAVEEMIAVLFGGGQVVEWFDFDETEGEIIPGEFDLFIDAALPENIDELIAEINTIIAKVKNARSRLRHIGAARYLAVPLVAGALVQSFAVVPITQILNDEEKPVETAADAGALAQSWSDVTISQVLGGAEAETTTALSGGGLAEPYSEVYISV